MYLIMIIIATVMFSFQFILNDGFRREDGSSFISSLKFTLYSSIAGIIVLLVINKLHVEARMFSVLTACVYSIVFIALNYSSIKAFEQANLSVYSVFSMIGGMVLPFLYGIMSGEEFKAIRLICLLLITMSVVMSIKKEEQSKKATKYYIMVFILNGLVGVISKFHQSYTDLCADSGSFMIITKIITAVFSAGLLCSSKKRSFIVNGKALIYSALYAVLNSIGNLLLLVSLLHLPASVQYPVVTGGVIVISTVIVIARKEKITKKEILAACIAFFATAFMAI